MIVNFSSVAEAGIFWFFQFILKAVILENCERPNAKKMAVVSSRNNISILRKTSKKKVIK